MKTADSPKKRKRVASPLPNRRKPAQHVDSKTIDMAEDYSAEVNDLFEAALGDTKALSKYNADHAELLRIEDKDAWDRDSRPKPMSRSQDDKIEQDAARIIRALREYERKVVFGNVASEAIPGKDTRDMGGQFLTNKNHIDEKSELFKVAQQVPKGGLLHLHFNAELHPERLLEQARSIDNLYIRSIRPLLLEDDLDQTEMVLTVLDPDQVAEGVDIFSKDYPGNATNWKTPDWKWKVWMPWKQFREDFKQHFSSDKYVQPQQTTASAKVACCSEPYADIRLNPAEFWLKSKMVLSEKEAYDFDQTVNG
jgi:adenosine deaminase CECR1